eukprot:6176486-Pleurochrysis_carterae.AAC.3
MHSAALTRLQNRSHARGFPRCCFGDIWEMQSAVDALCGTGKQTHGSCSCDLTALALSRTTTYILGIINTITFGSMGGWLIQTLLTLSLPHADAPAHDGGAAAREGGRSALALLACKR